jgi:hypothetical protein
MADRSSAEIFSLFFEVIDKHVGRGKLRKELAKKIWNASRNYDFHPYQLECDDALKRLGLARDSVKPDQYGEFPTLYGPK